MSFEIAPLRAEALSRSRVRGFLLQLQGGRVRCGASGRRQHVPRYLGRDGRLILSASREMVTGIDVRGQGKGGEVRRGAGGGWEVGGGRASARRLLGVLKVSLMRWEGKGRSRTLSAFGRTRVCCIPCVWRVNDDKECQQ